MTAPIELDAEERALVCRWHTLSVGSYVAFNIAILMPFLAFATYGFVKDDVIAMSIAVGGLVLYQAWRVATDLSRWSVYRSVFAKVAARNAVRVD
jgi:hypothetical protein